MPSLMILPEVAGLFRVSVQAVRSWRRTGKLVPVRTPTGRYRYKAVDVMALLGAGS
jgi:predicted site-specific integrase-resolvase